MGLQVSGSNESSQFPVEKINLIYEKSGHFAPSRDYTSAVENSTRSRPFCDAADRLHMNR